MSPIHNDFMDFGGDAFPMGFVDCAWLDRQVARMPGCDNAPQWDFERIARESTPRVD
jgi:hypothetical protein